MKYIIALLLLSTQLHAASIDCWSGGKKIYHGVTDMFLVNDQIIIASYKNYDDVILRKNKKSPNCVITKYISQDK